MGEERITTYPYTIRLDEKKAKKDPNGSYQIVYKGQPMVVSCLETRISTKEKLTKEQVRDLFQGTQGIEKIEGDFLNKELPNNYYIPTLDEMYDGFIYERYIPGSDNRYKRDEFSIEHSNFIVNAFKQNPSQVDKKLYREGRLFLDMVSRAILRLVCLRGGDLQVFLWDQKPCQQNVLQLGVYQAQYNRQYNQGR